MYFFLCLNLVNSYLHDICIVGAGGGLGREFRDENKL